MSHCLHQVSASSCSFFPEAGNRVSSRPVSPDVCTSLLGRTLGAQLPHYYQVLTAPISKVSVARCDLGISPASQALEPFCGFVFQVLDDWFESEPLKATLATDAVIGAMTSPHTPGSG